MKCGSNTKKLYKTLNQIISKNKEVTLPPEKDMDCTNNLLNHFMDKLRRLMRILRTMNYLHHRQIVPTTS